MQYVLLVGVLLGIVLYVIGKHAERNHPKYPPTDTLGGWD